MTTVRQPISRLPLRTTVLPSALIPLLENPSGEKTTVAASVETIAEGLAKQVLFEVIVRIALFLGASPSLNEMVLRYQFPERVSFPANLTQSLSGCEIAPTSEASFSLRKNGVEFGTLTFAAAETEGVFASSAVTFDSEDVLSIVSLSGDATFSNISITLAGGREDAS